MCCLISIFPANAEQNANPAGESRKSKILLLPFSIQSDADLNFLQEGIRRMLHSRLSLSGKTDLIDFKAIPEPLNQAAALELGQQQHADYVVMGNLTVFGDSVSTDATLFDIKSRNARLHFSEFGKSRGDAVAHINRFATQINTEVFGYRPPAATPARYNDQPYAGSPERRAYYEDRPRIWKSRRFKTRLIALTVGDVDGDGSNETVFADEKTIYVYRFRQNAFSKIARIPGDDYDRIIGIDTCDLNQNGRAEIFVSNITEKNRLLRSYVLEWENGRFVTIADDQNWFFRTIRMPEREKVVMGQKKGFPPRLFSGKIHEITLSGGRYTGIPREDLPDDISAWGLAYGDIRNEETPRIMTYNSSNHLTILRPDGSEEWTSSEVYGGSPSYIEYPAEIREKDFRNDMDRFYLPQRIHIADLDQDGKNEIFAVYNHEITDRLFQRFRSFDYGYIECLTWNALGLQRKWKTQKISGYISDFTVADLNNDGREELVFCAVSKGRNLLSEKKSYIASYTYNQAATTDNP
jgi:TolB-like protein